jgi:hypothetical protein
MEPIAGKRQYAGLGATEWNQVATVLNNICNTEKCGLDSHSLTDKVKNPTWE